MIDDMYPENSAITDIIKSARQIVIVQADNPDADSLGSALALETILGDLGKEPYLYCGIDMPTYLRYMAGWDRVSSELPPRFDASIIVDASTMTLLEKLSKSGHQGWLAAKPCIVLDHHSSVDNLIPFASVVLNDPGKSSTGELIYTLAGAMHWSLSVAAQTYLMSAILGDTQGLSNQLASTSTYRIVADMIEAGVDRADLEERRREYSKLPPVIFRYKADLIKRTELTAEGKIASVSIPQAEITAYSPLYNPAPLIQGDMLQTEGVVLSIVFKHYDDGKVTAAIRANPGGGIAASLAEHFGGGGHPYASGFKVNGGRSFPELKSECLAYAATLLADMIQETTDATA
jgi:phosphoesterase RecJ-like protein